LHHPAELLALQQALVERHLQAALAGHGAALQHPALHPRAGEGAELDFVFVAAVVEEQDVRARAQAQDVARLVRDGGGERQVGAGDQPRVGRDEEALHARPGAGR